MKKLLPLIAAACLYAFTAMGTIHTITVGDFAFVPSTIPNAHVGDTVKWVWNNGSHTTTSTTVPTGASVWDVPLNSGSTSFSYKLLVAGTYTYHCTPHAPNMNGSITVSVASGVGSVNGVGVLGIHPNPVSDKLYVDLKGGQQTEISIIDALGRCVSTGSYSGKAGSISIANIPAGMYLVRASTGGEVSMSAVEVRH